MAVMLMTTIPRQGREDQEQMVDPLMEKLIGRPGFLFDAGGAVGSGWRLHDVWESHDQLERWLDDVIFPGLPENAPTPEMDIVPRQVVGLLVGYVVLGGVVFLVGS